MLFLYPQKWNLATRIAVQQGAKLVAHSVAELVVQGARGLPRNPAPRPPPAGQQTAAQTAAPRTATPPGRGTYVKIKCKIK